MPREQAATFPEPLQRLMGYQMGAYALGYIDDLRDPINVLTGEQSNEVSFAGESEDARATVEARQQRAMEDIGELKADVKAVLGMLNQARGGWKAYVAVGALAAGIGAVMAKLSPFVTLK